MKFTLRQLDVFLGTARLENLSRAAEALSMSQSAASDSLRELENQFDLQLFDRVGKRLQLNDFGRLLLPKAEELISRATDLEDTLSSHHAQGRLRVGATLSIGNTLCIPMISQYKQRYPESQISLVVANTEQISHMVEHYELDVALIEGEINNPALEITRWRDDELLICCSPDHPLAGNSSLGKQDLLQASWILRESGSGTRQTFDRIMHELLPELKLELELQHTEAIIQAVRKGLGLGCLSQLTLAESFTRGDLLPLKARGRQFTRSFYQIIHKQKFRSAAIQHWLDLSEEFAV